MIPKSTKLGANAVASGIDAHTMHNGVTFQIGNTPVSNTTSTLHSGAFNMTSVNIGAIDSFTLHQAVKIIKQYLLFLLLTVMLNQWVVH